jgi:hypothetical protein
MLSCQVEGTIDVVRSATEPRWVRTVDGWEHAGSWNLEAPRGPSLHPLVVAAGQGMLSVLGLLWFDQGKR